ncbi:hypothetical protein FRC10_006256, partial [Ceratobasidium sp. 414]
ISLDILRNLRWKSNLLGIRNSELEEALTFKLTQPTAPAPEEEEEADVTEIAAYEGERIALAVPVVLQQETTHPQLAKAASSPILTAVPTPAPAKAVSFPAQLPSTP